jgi:hypothetical protein
MVRIVEAAPAGPWLKKCAICSAHSGAGQIFLDEWLDAIG